MIGLSHEKLKDIAEDIDIGYRYFIHRKTQELISFPEGMDDDVDLDDTDETEDPDDMFDDENPFKDDIRKVLSAPSDYVEIEKMNAKQSFSVMEDFLEMVDDSTLRNRLSLALGGKKPFAHFKHEIHQSESDLKKWYDFKIERMIEWVSEQLSNLK